MHCDGNPVAVKCASVVGRSAARGYSSPASRTHKLIFTLCAFFNTRALYFSLVTCPLTSKTSSLLGVKGIGREGGREREGGRGKEGEEKREREREGWSAGPFNFCRSQRRGTPRQKFELFGPHFLALCCEEGHVEGPPWSREEVIIDCMMDMRKDQKRG